IGEVGSSRTSAGPGRLCAASGLDRADGVGGSRRSRRSDAVLAGEQPSPPPGAHRIEAITRQLGSAVGADHAAVLANSRQAAAMVHEEAAGTRELVGLFRDD